VGTPVVRVRAVVDDVSTTLATHYARPDVAAAHPAAGAGLAGFEGWVDVAGVGPSFLAVVADLGDGTTYDIGQAMLYVE
jgi:hypothetical protein